MFVNASLSGDFNGTEGLLRLAVSHLGTRPMVVPANTWVDQSRAAAKEVTTLNKPFSQPQDVHVHVKPKAVYRMTSGQGLLML